MKFRYSEWDEDLARLLRAFKNLMQLFNHLVLKFSGDVERALRYMKMLQQQGYIDPNVNLEELAQAMEQEGFVERHNDHLVLTNKGELKIRQDAFNQLFSSLRKTGLGDHAIPASGASGEVLPETRPYEFGDPAQDINFRNTLNNAMKRGIEQFSFREEDFEVHEREYTTSCATVLMVDISHSMILYGEDRITPAKQVALALSELIFSKYPKDSLSLVVFGDDAREVQLGELPYLQVGPYHTNTKAGLRLAQEILRKKKYTNRQIFMVTDGKPTAIWDGESLYRCSWGLDERIVDQTLEEAALCRRNKITVTTFMLATDPWLVEFVEQLTKVNRGRAYYASLEHLGDYILVDYVRNRRRVIK